MVPSHAAFEVLIPVRNARAATHGVTSESQGKAKTTQQTSYMAFGNQLYKKPVHTTLGRSPLPPTSDKGHTASCTTLNAITNLEAKARPCLGRTFGAKFEVWYATVSHSQVFGTGL